MPEQPGHELDVRAYSEQPVVGADERPKRAGDGPVRAVTEDAGHARARLLDEGTTLGKRQRAQRANEPGRSAA